MSLHDQKSDATIDRYSVHEGGGILFMFNEVEATARQVFEAFKTGRETAPNAHKVMTAEEYQALDLKGWHSVCKDYDGPGSVGIRYHGEPIKEEWMTDPKRLPMIEGSLRTRCEEMRKSAQQARAAYKKDYFGKPWTWFADVLDDAASVLEEHLRTLSHPKGTET